MKKLDPKIVKDEFALRGWKLIDSYTKSSVSLKAICPNGHETKISWNNLQKGQGCQKCAGNFKFEYQEVKNYFEAQGCELLESCYTNSVTPLEYRCSCGNISKMDFGNFRLGRRCQKCKGKSNSENLALTEDEVKAKVESYGVRYVKSSLEWSVDRNRTRLTYICKCGQETTAWLSNFYKVQNCKKCGSAKISGDKCHMYDPDREAVKMRKKFRKICGQHIHRFMKATAQKKTKHTHELLGYRPKDLQEHILNHPNMANCKGQEWHVDHIWPIQAFVDHGILDLKIINALSNLRPIPGQENILKAAKYNKVEFEEWLENYKEKLR